MAAVARPDATTTKLQKMLDLERKFKMERLHTRSLTSSSDFSATSPAEQEVATTQALPRPPPLQARRRNLSSTREPLTVRSTRPTMEDQDVSPVVPSPSSMAFGAGKASGESTSSVPLSQTPPPKQLPKSVTFLPSEKGGEDDNNKSDAASSICQSPSWEGYNQRKKEKKVEAKQRRRDKEQAEQDEREAREARRKSTSRLTKAPPPSASRSHLTETASTTDLPRQGRGHRRHSNQADPALPPPTRPNYTRKRSSSVASQLRAAFTGLTSRDPKESKESQTEGKEVGFVGGLKLEKEREAAAAARRRVIAAELAASHSADPRHSDSSSSASGRLSKRKSPNMPEARASAPALHLHPALQQEPNLMADFTAPLRHRGAPPVSLRGPSQPASPATTPSLLPPFGPDFSHSEERLSRKSQDSPSTDRDSSRKADGSPSLGDWDANTSENAASRGRRVESYVRHQLQQSRDRAVAGFKDEARVSARSHYPPQANRQHHNRSFSLAPDANSSSSSIPAQRPSSSGGVSRSCEELGNESDGVAGCSKPYKTPVLELMSPLDTLARDSRERAKSKQRESLPPSSTASRGFMGALQATFQRVNPISAKSPPPITTEFGQQQPQHDPARSSVSAGLEAGNTHHSSQAVVLPKEMPPFGIYGNNIHGSARPSSSSSSYYGDSLRSPSSINTPDSSRPQSDGELPPLAKGLVKGFFDLSRPGSKDSMMPSLNLSQAGIDCVHSAPGADHDADSFKTCRMPSEEPEEQCPPECPVELPAEPAPISRADDAAEPEKETVMHGQSGRDGAVERSSRRASLTGEAASGLTRTSHVMKSRTGRNMASQPASSGQPALDGQVQRHVPVPPPRSRARVSPTHRSSVTLSDALPSPPLAASTETGPHYREASSSPPSGSPQLPPQSNPSQGAFPRPLRTPRLSGSRKEEEIDPMAKMFVECCNCKFFHDMPSRVYECMAHPDAEVADPRLGVSGAITTVVNCPWCKHGMTTRCCAGYAAIVYLKERLH